MTRKGIVVSAALTLLSAAAHAGSAPKELYGKSIVVAWSESRDQRVETEKEVRNFGQAVQMNLYISTAGRPFLRTIERSWVVMIFAVIRALVPLRKLDQVCRQLQQSASISRNG